MISFHVQNSPPNWLDAVAQLPNKTPVKIVMGAERCAEVKATNPNLITWYRWVAPDQNLYPGGYEQQARNYFNRYVDDTFKSDRVAPHVDLLQEPFNEYLANSQGPEEKKIWINWALACAKVWYAEYRSDPRLEHIRLVLAGAGVGNDIPLQFAEIASLYDCLLDSHSYTPMSQGKIMPDNGIHPDGGEINGWKYYEGRFEQMDEYYLANGYSVDWALGEGGPVRDASPWYGHLQPDDGWRHPDCCDTDLYAYMQAIDHWLKHAIKTKAFKEDRLIGMTLFTSGGGNRWKYFETKQPEMNHIAGYVKSFMDNLPDDPPPPPPPCRGEPRIQYHRVSHVAKPSTTLQQWLAMAEEAYPERRSITFSYDDAGVGDLDRRTAVLVGLDTAQERETYTSWYETHYPGVTLEFRDFPQPETPLIVDITDDLPKHPDKEYELRSQPITHLIIHHTVTPDDFETENIAHYHIQTNDWPGIGYHYVIDHPGRIEKTNHNSTESYHARSANPYSLGIALKGNFTDDPPTVFAIAALDWLIATLQHKSALTGADNLIILGHRETPGNETACPGDTWPQWKNQIL
jgi:hypothetical protein